MDSQRFDELTKAFAAGTSRRAVLRAALGGMSAGLLGLAGGTGASAKGAHKSSDAGPVPCGEIEGLECSDGFTCVEGFCLDDDGTAGKRHCVEACKEQFGPGRQRGQCISACAKAKGGGTPPGPGFCGGIGNLPCPEGFTCVDDPADDCDPAKGADCGGICVPIEGTGGETCGQTTCPEGVPCCNPSCGICGESCIQVICEG